MDRSSQCCFRIAAAVVVAGLAAGTLRAGHPPASRLILAPPDQVRLAYQKPESGVTVLTWRGVEGAVKYRIVLATDRELRKLVFERSLAAVSTSARGLAAGRYYWRVEAVDPAGATIASDAATFSIGLLER